MPVPVIVTIEEMSCMMYCALTRVIGKRGMGRIDAAKERLRLKSLDVRILMQLVGRRMYALPLHTKKMPVSMERHTMR